MARPVMLTLTERVAAASPALSPSERRVAEAVLADRAEVAFGTVAGLARRAGTGGSTVVRCAAKLGYDGFVALQAAVREELSHQLRPASERVRELAPDDVLGRTLRADLDNVQTTLAGLSRPAFMAAIGLLAKRSARVRVLSGEASSCVAVFLADHLSMLREGVAGVEGSPVRVTRHLATLAQRDVVVAIDLRRYDRWLLEAVAAGARRGVSLIAISDSAVSPLARHAAVAFTVSADSVGPFDSHVGALALADALVAGVAARLLATATDRLDRIEAAWTEASALDRHPRRHR